MNKNLSVKFSFIILNNKTELIKLTNYL